MEKRLLTAFALSAVILFGWQFVMSHYFPAPPPGNKPAVLEQAPAPVAAEPPAPLDPAAQAALPQEPEREFLVRTAKWNIKFSTRGGVPTSWKLLVGPEGERLAAADGGDLELIPQQRAEQMGLPFRLLHATDETRDLNALPYAPAVDGQPVADVVDIAPGRTAELTFSSADPATGQPVVKRFVLGGDRFDFTFAAEGPVGAFVIGPRIGDQSVTIEDSYSNVPPQIVTADAGGSVNHFAGSSVNEGAPHRLDTGPVRWAGVADSYFAMVATTGAPDARVRATNVKAKFSDQKEGDDTTHDFLSVIMPLQAGQPVHMFVGPKEKNLLDAVSVEAAKVAGAPVDLDGMINYGFFGRIVKPIVQVIDWALRHTHKVVPNYGWAIVLLTTVFNLLFFPLKYKSTVAMRRAAKLQPRMKELQEKMKKVKFDDPEFKKLQAEQMSLMKEGNPLGGCLPLLVQMPFFWAFFVYLTTSFLVRHAPFVGWVKDLSTPDHYYILPILMVIAQIGATMIMPMPQSDDPAMKLQRQLMTWVMPIVFAYFFLAAAPSGLVLYWMTLNLVNVGVQLAINKMIPPEPQGGEGPDVKAGGKKKKAGPEGKLAVAE
jgi:YidC/Oxa1 family membrane protein insertase